jgi:ribosomal protein S18 acetylase RimI-like enzyme
MRWQPMRLQDAAAWADVIADAELADQTGEHYDADDLLEELQEPGLDLGAATLAAWDGDRLAGMGLLRMAGSAVPANRVFFDGVVRPAYRRQGVGSQLLAWAVKTTPQISRARYPHAPVELHVDVNDGNEGKRALFSREGFVSQRWFFGMRRPLDGELPPVRVPDGYRVEPFDADRHDEAARQVRNASFVDHWGSSQMPPDAWKQWFTGTRAFRPDLSFVAVAHGTPGDELAAILLSQYYEADTVATGRSEAWISTIGTRREHRRRGVAGALLAAALRQAQQSGFAQAGLGVDADSPSGALGFYQSAGFTIQHKHARYVRAL